MSGVSALPAVLPAWSADLIALPGGGSTVVLWALLAEVAVADLTAARIPEVWSRTGESVARTDGIVT